MPNHAHLLKHQGGIQAHFDACIPTWAQDFTKDMLFFHF